MFAASSAQQYAWMQEHHPELFERIRRRRSPRAGSSRSAGCGWSRTPTCPAARRWRASSWPASGSSSRSSAWTRRRCGCPTRSATPRRCRRSSRPAGARWFLTQKISWNETNVMPHHTFRWEGIDGTRIFTHFPPVDTYNAQLSGPELARAQRQYAEKGRANTSLVPFGWGDGGGGPTREMLAAAAPHAVAGGLADGTDRRRPRSSSPPPRPSTRGRPSGRASCTWSSTAAPTPSQARTKRGNRRSEHLLREAELWAATAAVRTGAPYPAEVLRALLADGAAAAVPRHPARHVDRLGAPARPSATTRGSPPSWRT